MAGPRELVKDRRRAFRITVAGAFKLRHPAIPAPLPVLDISSDGFAIESPVPFLPAVLYRFDFDAIDGAALSVDAVVARCLSIEDEDSGRFLAGFRFVTKSSSQRANVAKILNAVAVAL